MTPRGNQILPSPPGSGHPGFSRFIPRSCCRYFIRNQISFNTQSFGNSRNRYGSMEWSPVPRRRVIEGRRCGMSERDFIIGKVTDVIDGETFRITVDRTGGKNRHGYKDQEKIHIKKIKLTDITWMTGVFTKSKIEKMFRGKKVLCLIRSRDQAGKIIADVQLVHGEE